MIRSQQTIERASYAENGELFERSVRAIEAARLAKGRPFRAFVRTFGCQQNENDSEKIRGILYDLGFEEAQDYDDADLILINTCSIRDNADQRLFGHLGKIKELKEKGQDLICGVCGCLPTQEEQARKIRESFSYVNLLFGPADIGRLPALLGRVYSGEKRVYDVSGKAEICENLPSLRERKDRALISIMYGCDNFCSYCVVPYTRGRERSRQAADILRECRTALEEGIPELMLLGQNVNAWGYDLSGKRLQFPSLSWQEEDRERLLAVREGREEPRTFAQLLAAISGLPGLRCLRYMSSHPRDFTGELLLALAMFPEIENHLHLPVQSGSSRILKAMNRHYDRERYLDIVKAVRVVRPQLSLSTDVMVGFPGESEEDFQETLDLVKEAAFESAFTFIYSERPGTPAAELEQIPQSIRHERFNRLTELQNRLTREAYEAIQGSTRSVLLEGRSRAESDYLTARDSEFHLINLRLPETKRLPKEALDENGVLRDGFFPGRSAQVKILHSRGFSAEAEILTLEERCDDKRR